MDNIKAGASIIDITPPLEAGILMSSVKELYQPFTSVRLPLKGRIIVIEYKKELIAVVALDLLGINHSAIGGWDKFKKAIEGSIKADKIIITCTHTHSSSETAGLTDLYKTDIYKHWEASLKNKIKDGIEEAIKKLMIASLSIGVSELQGYSLQRRITVNGEIKMSDSMQPITNELFEKGPVDRRVHALRFNNNSGGTIATIIHAICHPVNDMCSSYVSSDYPGELCLELENRKQSGIPLFFNGTCGDINPPTVSDGREAAKKHGMALANVVKNIDWKNHFTATPVRHLSKSIKVQIRANSGITDEDNGILRLNVLRIGDVALIFLPGEPFTDTATDIEKDSPFPTTIVIGYSENYVGYIPNERIFKEGGYETGPGKWSYLEKKAESKIRSEIKKMLSNLHSEN